MKPGYVIAFMAATMLLSSCEIVGGIFKAGMGVGIFIVILIIAIIGWLIYKAKK